MSILSRKIYAACSSEIFLSEILVENQNCTISVGIFSVYISKGFIPFRNRVIPNADHCSCVLHIIHNVIILLNYVVCNHCIATVGGDLSAF